MRTTTTILLALTLVLGVVAVTPGAAAWHCTDEHWVTELRCEAAHTVDWLAYIISDIICC